MPRLAFPRIFQRRSHSVGAALALLIVSALAAAGCSSAASSDSAGGTSSGGSSAATLNVFTTTPTGIPYFPVNHGNQLDAWSGDNIKVNLIEGTAGTAVDALASGKADISIGSAVTIAGAITQGLQAKIVGASQLAWGQNLVVSKASGITTAQGMKGHTFGVSSFSSAGYYAMLKIAQKYGWSKSDYHVTVLSTIDALSAALKSGTIQGFVWNPQQVAQLADQGVGVDLGSVDSYVGDTIGSAFAVSDSALKSKPAAIKAFFTGYYALVKKLQANPAPVLNLLVQDEQADKSAVQAVLDPSVDDWSTAGDMPQANQQGLAEAVTVLIPSVKSVNMSSIVQPWQGL
jgi:ABC-type nitrate/sulfonate/bicarbonate transport system substrate-binding protein